MITSTKGVKEHFDSIADDYYEEIPRHIREHLNEKWWALVSEFIPPEGRVVDLGCGDGTNVAFLRSKGVDCVGLDLSPELIRRGKERYPDLRDHLGVGDLLALEPPDQSFDVAVVTGVLHHIHSRQGQEKALREALRVVREGGVLIVRECNIFNPLFRFYWNYLFPLLTRIDRFGGELWIPPSTFRRLFPGELETIKHCIFVPSFAPRSLLRLIAPLEKALEASWLRAFSAHYVAILRRRS